MEEQVQKRAGGDRNHGEPEPRAAGERAARARGGAFPGPEPEERGGAPRGGGRAGAGTWRPGALRTPACRTCPRVASTGPLGDEAGGFLGMTAGTRELDSPPNVDSLFLVFLRVRREALGFPASHRGGLSVV